MISRQKTDYFDKLRIQSEYSLKASELFKDFLRQYTLSDIFDMQNKFEALKNFCKHECNELLAALKCEFLPPLDREDILALSRSLEAVFKNICDVFECIYIYNPNSLTRHTVILFSHADSICKEMHKAVCEMKNFKKSNQLQKSITSCFELKEEADKAYVKALRDLMSTSNDMRKILSFTKIYDSIIKCCDACKSVVLLLETAVMKNV